MILNLKVSDGDFVFVNIGGKDITQKYIDIIKSHLEKWAAGKGLRDITFMVTAGLDVKVTKFTVNDIFENEVLKGDSDGK